MDTSPQPSFKGVCPVWRPNQLATGRGCFPSTPGIVIDAGAQVGLFTGTAVALGHHVLAVDARPDHAQMITTSLKLNGLSHAATVAHAALGSECGKTVTIQQDIVGNPGSSHVDDYRRRLLQLQEEKERRRRFSTRRAHTRAEAPHEAGRRLWPTRN